MWGIWGELVWVGRGWECRGDRAAGGGWRREKSGRAGSAWGELSIEWLLGGCFGYGGGRRGALKNHC